MVSQHVSLQTNNPAYHIPELVQLACTFDSHIIIRCHNAEYNAKSIMGMMSLDLREGKVNVTAEGSDEEDAITAITEFLSK